MKIFPRRVCCYLSVIWFHDSTCFSMSSLSLSLSLSLSGFRTMHRVILKRGFEWFRACHSMLRETFHDNSRYIQEEKDDEKESLTKVAWSHKSRVGSRNFLSEASFWTEVLCTMKFGGEVYGLAAHWQTNHPVHGWFERENRWLGKRCIHHLGVWWDTTHLSR